MRFILAFVGNYKIMRAFDNPIWRSIAGAWFMTKGEKVYLKPEKGWQLVREDW